MVKRSEFFAKLEELFGDEDVEIYFDSIGESTFTSWFEVYKDGDGDAVIQPK